MSHFLFRKGNKCLIYSSMDNVVDAEPYNYFLDYYTKRIYNSYRLFIPWDSEYFKSKAQKEAVKQLEEIESTYIPSNIQKLIEISLDKKEQISILKGAQILAVQLCALFLHAGKLGYKFSNFRIEKENKSSSETELPKIIVVNEDKSVDYYGKTSLKSGELRGLVNQKKVLIAKIIDNGKMWHCFYQTLDGVYGQERGERGRQPHIHYWSNTFGLKKDDIIQKIKEFKMPSSQVHINFEHK